MLISSSVSLPVNTKDAKEAVHQVLDMIQSRTTTLDNIKISIGLISMAYPDVLLLLAKSLPEEAKCFGMDRSTSAGEFIKTRENKKSPMPDSCDCDLTDYFSATDAVTLIKSLFNASPRAIRSTSFNINVENINWCGANDVGTGKIHFFDLKAFHRKKRFSLIAMYSCRGENSKDESIKILLRAITNETGIKFDKGTMDEAVDQEIVKKPIQDESLLPASVSKKCLDRPLGQLKALI